MSLDMLGHLADILLEATPGPFVGATLVRVVFHRGRGDDFELGLKPLDCHPTEALDGFRAPRSWTALGVIAGGWAAPMDDGIRPSAHPDAMRVTNVVLMDRKGRMVGRVRYPDGSVVEGPPGYGAIVDALRYSLHVRQP